MSRKIIESKKKPTLVLLSGHAVKPHSKFFFDYINICRLLSTFVRKGYFCVGWLTQRLKMGQRAKYK